jgi:hypothetical protein
VATIYHKVARGELKPIKNFDRRLRFDLRDFDAMVEAGKKP